jgi:isopenicillin N synthase-like dioxygenase
LSVPFFFDPNWDAFIEPVLPGNDGDDTEQHHGVRYQDKFIAAMGQQSTGYVPLSV